MFTFIVGCGRSGTTLLRAMLDSHGQLAIPPESYFLIPTLRIGGGRTPLPDERVEALLETIIEFPSFAEWQLPADVARERVRAARPRSAAELLTTLYATYAEVHGKPRYGDKTPYHVRHIERLAADFPDARFVHLLRDGRDVAASLVKSHFGPTSIPAGALFWRRHVEEGRAAGARLPADRYMEVRYEDLVSTPEETLQRLVAFLGMTFDRGMLTYHERADELLGGMRRADHLQGIARPPAKRSDWRKTMSKRDVTLFDLLAGDLAEELGYERPSVNPTAAERLSATAWRAREELAARAASLRARRANRLRAAKLASGAAGRTAEGEVA